MRFVGMSVVCKINNVYSRLRALYQPIIRRKQYFNVSSKLFIKSNSVESYISHTTIFIKATRVQPFRQRFFILR